MATKRIKINAKGDTIPIHVNEVETESGIFHVIDVDDVEWVRTPNMTHAAVLFNMMADHITEYMHYELKK